MIALATVPGTEGFPLWALLLSVLLTGGGGAALWNMISARMKNTADREVTASTANLNDVSALNSAITGLAGENSRLSKRLADVELQVEALKSELSQRPTKEELKADVGTLQARVDGLQSYVEQLRSQLTAAGIVPKPEAP